MTLSSFCVQIMQVTERKRARTADAERERLEKVARHDDAGSAEKPQPTAVFDLGNLDFLL